MARTGLSLVEVLAVVACLGLLTGILAPSLSSAREMARQAACTMQLHQVGVGLSTYVGLHRFCMPPFQFSDGCDNLPASGHWGGPSQFDPMTFSNPRPINLGCLVAERMLPAAALVCPAASGDLRSGRSSLFPYTSQWSTYCLRFPPSADLFSESPVLGNYGGKGLLGVYLMNAGGTAIQKGKGFSGASPQTVPLVRLNRRYALDSTVRFSRTTFDPAADAVLSDEFWWQDRREPAPQVPSGLASYPITAGWCHGQQFNVLYGGGAVHTVRDDGIVAANSVPPGGTRVDSGVHFGKYAERIWQSFDAAR
ncbi:MAG: hypothetical protein MUP47_11100 [Phycisphaerae bacterium]|nr:hypothetical protein [Phycisphaerae bacterium]